MRRVAIVVGLGFAAILVASAASAAWQSQANGGSHARARTMPAGNAPTVTVSGTAWTVSWSQVTFAGSPLGTVTGGGYVVWRYADGSSTPVAPGPGCSGTISGAGATLSCTENAVPAGMWHYTVTPALSNWRGAESAQSGTPPVNALSLVGQSGGSYLTGTTLYYRGAAAGSFMIQNAVVATGSTPASSDFAAFVGSSIGWTHATPDLQTTPAGGPYVSNAFSWTAGTTSAPSETVTGADTNGNRIATTLSFVVDNSSPSGGALTVNGQNGTGGSGSSSYNKTGSFPIDVRTDYSSDGGSGLASSVLTVRFAPWSGNACGTFGSSSVIAGSPPQTASSGDGCYEYTLTGTDRVGNVATRRTTVKVDQTAPVTTDNTASIGSAWFNTTQTVTLSSTDSPGSGVAQTYYTTDGSTPTTSSATGTSITLSATGVYTIKYFSVDNAGVQEAVKTAGTQIHIDKALPTNAFSLGAANGAYLSGTTLYFNSATGGSFTLADAVTDNHSGPASATFPGISTSGWMGHTTAETVSSGSGSAPTITYTSGTYTFGAGAGTPTGSVTSNDIANNTSASTTITFIADSTATAPTITFPVGGSSRYNDTTWNNGCSSAICGTASDAASGVQKVEVSVRQGSGNYWDGSGFTSGSQVWNLASGTTSWSLPFAASNFPAEGAYTVRVRVTDRVGNVSSYTSVTFTIDRTAPTATNVVLANGGTLERADKGDSVTVTYSETMDASSFCSTWVNGSTQTKSGTGGGVVATITDNGASDTLSSVTASGCTFHFGTVALSANYVSSTATFSGSGSNASSVTWDPTARTLRIVFGALASGSTNLTVLASTPSYTPDAVLKDTAGNAIGSGPYSGSLSSF